ncbi:hypothetical protein AB5N19_06687 [Seiridium cardinale]
MAPKRSTRMQTVDKLLDGYGSLSVPTLLEPLAEDFQHHVLPESLEMPSRDKEGFAQHAAGVFGIFDKFQMVPIATWEDKETNAVVVHASMQGIMKRGASEWRNECVMMVRLSADGHKVLEITEFVDSAKAQQMRQRHAPEVFSSAGAAASWGWFANLVPSFKQAAAVCVLYQVTLIVALRLAKSAKA